MTVAVGVDMMILDSQTKAGTAFSPGFLEGPNISVTQKLGIAPEEDSR